MQSPFSLPWEGRCHQQRTFPFAFLEDNAVDPNALQWLLLSIVVPCLLGLLVTQGPAVQALGLRRYWCWHSQDSQQQGGGAGCRDFTGKGEP